MSANQIPSIVPDQAETDVALQRGKHAPLRQLLHAKAKIAKTGNDRRRFQRVNIPLLGRFMRQNKQEYPCQIINVSAGGIAVLAPISGELGERIVIYLDTLGRIEGEIARITPDGFALRLRASNHKREKSSISSPGWSTRTACRILRTGVMIGSFRNGQKSN